MTASDCKLCRCECCRIERDLESTRPHWLTHWLTVFALIAVLAVGTVSAATALIVAPVIACFALSQAVQHFAFSKKEAAALKRIEMLCRADQERAGATPSTPPRDGMKPREEP